MISGNFFAPDEEAAAVRLRMSAVLAVPLAVAVAPDVEEVPPWRDRISRSTFLAWSRNALLWLVFISTIYELVQMDIGLAMAQVLTQAVI